MKTHAETREDGSEIISYDFDDYPACVRRGKLSRLPGYTGCNHWHDDLEFTAVLSGSMLFNVNGVNVRVEAGQGIFINARRYHYCFSPDSSECDYIDLLLHPMLLCASPGLEDTFVTPYLSGEGPPYRLLHRGVPWENGVLEDIKTVYECRGEGSAPLRIQGLFFRIWLNLYEHVFKELTPPEHPEKSSQKLNILKNMILYIERSYREKITLEDIAKVGFLSKSGCLSLFKRYLNETPINYLIRYRLKISTRLLCSTGSSVTEIAYLVGFSNASYFTECFRKLYDCTPLEYRKTHAVSDIGKKLAR